MPEFPGPEVDIVLRRSQYLPLALLTLALSWPVPLKAGPQASGPEYVYTSNFGDFTISGFSFNTNTGELKELAGSPFPTGIGPEAFAATRNGHFLYLSLGEWSEGGPCGNDLAHAVSYAIAPTTGELKQLDEVILPEYCPSDLIVDPTGNFVYVALIDFDFPKVGAIAAYKTSAGVMTAVDGSPFLSPIQVPPGQKPAIGMLALSRDGTVLYASDPNNPAGILIFDRDTSSGSLSFRTTFNSETPLGPIAITPSGKFMVAAPPSGSGMYVYSIGPNGDLTPVPGSPFASPNVSITTGISISPNGKFVAVAEQGGITIQRMALKDGALSLAPGSPFGGFLPLTVTFDPSGNFVIVPGTVYRLHPVTGALSEVSNFTTGNFAWDIIGVEQ